jgi:diguanylate cyclase (GGDEF)-like protein
LATWYNPLSTFGKAADQRVQAKKACNMPNDIASLVLALTVSMITMAVALPAVMGQVNTAVRRAQAGVCLQALGWVLLLASNMVLAGSWADRALSTLSMAGIAGGLAFNAKAFDLWCGRNASSRMPAIIAVMLTAGYAAGFSSYAFRVGWANGLLALQMALVAITLARKPLVPVGGWRWLLVLALVSQVVVTAWRGALAAFDTAAFPSFMTPHPVNLLFTLVANATAVLSLIGILLAHRDEAARALERLATLDGLTAVLNRRAWLAHASVELANSTRYGHQLAVLLIDLDHFKQVNDSRGHEAGDHALQFFARALQSACRAGDLVCRYGGEEFCVLINRAELASTQSFDGRIRAYLAEAAPREIGHALDYSGGIAISKSADDTLEAMLRRADVALYSAKALGRGCTLDAEALHMAPT